jgi:phospholipid/cholesterol/gamma-HCH transport system substrate-binding protein/paraquat-inducible protein B
MDSEAKYFKLGLFVLSAVAIGVAAIVVLGAGTLLKKRFTVETYMDESIQGLDVGAPVKYRGVRIGELAKVDFVTKVYGVQSAQIRLLMNFNTDASPRVMQAGPVAAIQELSEKGMRVRLASAGLTGGVYLELDMMEPKEHPPTEITWTPEYPYMPSVQSTGSRLTTHVETILEQIEKMRLDQVAEKVSALVTDLDKVMKGVEPALSEIRGLAASAEGLVKDTRKVVTDDIGKELKALVISTRELLEKEVTPAFKSIRTSSDRLPGTFDKVDGTLEKINVTLRRIDRTLAEDAGSLDEAMDNLRVMTQDLRELTSQVKRYPATVLFGEAPPKKAVNK